MKNYVLLSEKIWNQKLLETFQQRSNEKWIHISSKKDFTYSELVKLKPDMIFIPHWSYIIPEKIYNHFECVVFHMTDLPFGRGGSPLQNLIEQGFAETKISALKVCKVLDGGDIYLKKDLLLSGTAGKIYRRANDIIGVMIKEIIDKAIEPVPQRGEIVTFKRRTPDMSDISNIDSLEKLYDHIRMLDAEGYPKAFLKCGNLKFEFSKASIKTNGRIIADVKISKEK